jgi:Malic enzyme, N-terminal domain
MLSSLLCRPATRHVSNRLVLSSLSVNQRVFFSSSIFEDNEPVPDTGEWKGCRRAFMAPLRIKTERGPEILHNPLYNKGMAFKSGERDRLGFRGLLPARVMNIHIQKDRFLMALRAEESKIKKNLMLEDLHDRNETLYHRVLVDHMDEMAPLIYTPTVGQACMEFAARFRRPRGMYFTEDDRGHMAAMVRAIGYML